MITIHMTPDDLVKMRFAYRPLMEIPLSYRVLNNLMFQNLHRRWVETAQQTLYDVELPYLAALVTAQGCYIPDFLTPTPTINRNNIEDDFESLLATPDAIIQKDVLELIRIDGESDMRHYFVVHPREAIGCLIEDLRLYWQRTLEHYWSHMISILEGDVLYRGRLLALEGPSAMIGDLHPTLACQGHEIQLRRDCQHVHPAYETTLHGEGLQLVPTIFAPKCMWQIVPEWQPMLCYHVRGGGLWGQKPPSQSLELALGAGRARVIQVLKVPSSTGEVAFKLRISAATASQHLSRLTRAGLIEPRRSGKRVYYHLTPRGADLLALFDRID